MQTIDEALNKLKKSDFRSRFHLKQKDIDYINEKGMNKIRSHSEDFVSTRLAPKYIPNDANAYEGTPCFYRTARLCLLLQRVS